MGVTQVEQEGPKRSWSSYIIGGTGILLGVLLIAAIILFQKEIQNAQAYGYAGVFVIGILCGVTVIPTPTQLLVFTMGAVLKPLYVGLVAGLGSAVGGITVYLTGAGMWKVWSKLRQGRRDSQYQPNQDENVLKQSKPSVWSKVQAFYNRLVNRLGKRGGDWVVFITSAMIFSPFYFAGLGAGSARMGLLRFFLLSWAGRTVRYLIIAYAGYWGLHAILKWIGA